MHLMSCGVVFVLCALPCVAVSAEPSTITASGAETASERKPMWNPNVSQALAANRGRPLAIVIGTQNCLWCDRLKSESSRHTDVQAAMQEVAGIELRADLNRGFAAALHVRAFPTTLLINRKGIIVRRIQGYIPSDDLAAALRVLAASGDKEIGEGELPDPTAGIADALASADPTARLAVMVGDGTAERRDEIRRLLMERADVVSRLWPMLEDASLAVRVDATAIIAAHIGASPDYDPFQPPESQRASLALWRATSTTATGAEATR